MTQKLVLLLLAVTMATSLFNTVAIAAAIEDPLQKEKVVCEICGHEHNGECGYIVPIERVLCSHVHDEECGFVEGAEGFLATTTEDQI